MSPSHVRLLNEAALVPVVHDTSVGILPCTELKHDAILGSGTFATCVSAMKGETIPCVVKIPRFLDYEQFDRELAAMLQCNRHKNRHIVRLLWICMPPDDTVGLPRFVLPLVEGAVMGMWLSGPIENVRLTSIYVVHQLLEAVLFLHVKVGIIHGDLNMKNIMIARNNHLTLIDFGNARDAARGQPCQWVHAQYAFSPPEALCERPCERILAETHVVGVLLICIERLKTDGLCCCPRPFDIHRDLGEISAIARLVQFWGRSRLFPFWSAFRRKVGQRIEEINGRDILPISGIIGQVGIRLAQPFPTSRMSIEEALRHLSVS